MRLELERGCLVGKGVDVTFPSVLEVEHLSTAIQEPDLLDVVFHRSLEELHDAHFWGNSSETPEICPRKSELAATRTKGDLPPIAKDVVWTGPAHIYHAKALPRVQRALELGRRRIVAYLPRALAVPARDHLDRRWGRRSRARSWVDTVGRTVEGIPHVLSDGKVAPVAPID